MWSPPWQHNDRSHRLILKGQRPMRKGFKKSNPLPLKVEAMPDQKNQVHSVEWAESLVWTQATTSLFANSQFGPP